MPSYVRHRLSLALLLPSYRRHRLSLAFRLLRLCFLSPQQDQQPNQRQIQPQREQQDQPCEARKDGQDTRQDLVELETNELRHPAGEPDEQNRSEKKNADIKQPQYADPGAEPKVEAEADTPCACEAELKIARAEHTALKKRTDRTEAKVADLYVGLRAKEASAALFEQAIGGRRQAQANSCTGQLLVANRVAEVNAACCGGGGGGADGHRRTQDESSGSACAQLPTQCTMACAPVFIAFRKDCEEMLEEAGMDMQQVERLHESCLQQISVDEGSCGAQIGRRILQRVGDPADTAVRNTGATTAMIIPLTIVTDAQTGMMEVLGQTGRRRSQEAGAETVQEFRCECGSGSISSCIPVCGEMVHGYELLLTIDETDIRVSW